MEKLFLTSRRVGARSNVIACAVVSAACGLVLIISPTVFASVSITGDVVPDASSFPGANEIHVGDVGDGTLLVDGGSDLLLETTYVGYGPAANGIATVDGDGTTYNNQGHVYVGYDGVGTFQITNGAAVLEFAQVLGHSVGSSGTTSVDGENSSLTCYNYMYIGNNGSGSMSVTGGGFVSSNVSYIGYSAGSTGTVTVDGTNSTWTDSFWIQIGWEGSGTLNITNGGQVTNLPAGVSLATWSGSSGELNVTGGALTTSLNGGLDVGVQGTASMTISAGGQVSNVQGNIATSEGSSGAVTVDGTGSSWTNASNLYVGRYGSGTLDITNGGTVSSQDGNVGYYTGSVGRVLVDGDQSAWTNSEDLFIGRLGDGTLVISNSGQVTCRNASIGGNTTGIGEMTVDGADSLLSTSSNLYVGDAGNGTLQVIRGGQVDVGGSTYVGRNVDSQRNLTFDTGVLNTVSLHASPTDLHGQGTINTHGLISNGNLVFDQTHGPTQQITLNSEPGQNVTINLDQTSAGRLGAGFHGNGTLTITDGRVIESAIGILGYHTDSNGDATVSGSGSTWNSVGTIYVGYLGSGSLLVTDGGQVTASTISIRANGQLAGDGVLTANVSNAGHVAPGQSPGTLHLDGDYSQQSDGTLDIELAAGVNDLLAITGSATLDGTLSVTLFDGFMPSPGQSFTILTASSISGTFATELLPELGGEQFLDVVYNTDSVMLTVLVPEPASLLLLLAGLALLAQRRRSVATVNNHRP